MLFRELPLPEAARGAAACAWRFALEDHDPPAIEHIAPPDGATNFVVIVGPDGQLMARFIGPALAARRIPVMRGWSYAGLRLRPEAALAVTGRAPDPALSEPLATDGPFAAIIVDLAALAVDDWRGGEGIAAALAGITGQDRAVADAVDRLALSGGTIPIARLAEQAGIGARQFRRRFLAATGIPAKQYASIQRVRRALLLSLGDPDWAGIASAAGFADQPHLARDIRGRFGAAPVTVRGYLGGIRHELIAPVRFVQDAAPRGG
ncbi:MAG: AraC family transcriptional regulator [Sphingomonas sp.]|nr:AraC family transcriptional regulator [Sphingomonas sp.]